MTHRRTPYKLRADGEPKDLQIHRRIVKAFGEAAALDPDGGVGWPPAERSAERTRSKAWRAGTRRTRRLAGGSRAL